MPERTCAQDGKLTVTTGAFWAGPIESSEIHVADRIIGFWSCLARAGLVGGHCPELDR